ncbi:MAG: prolipoprotein diacylglyceryl transferase [Chloroflexi bacterium]|nr:MAG: prolipoprotein diacylglyceryl transferase [Chloroflexota bacterium]PIE81014.1 MAG: prolipoprotein diacylglyceryl transferase [Chloroflexota bacterium]
MTLNKGVKVGKPKRKVEIYWIIIAVLLVILGGLYIYHLITGVTPDRVALSLGGFEVYWYGICIVGGIALGASVVSRLAEERGTAVFMKVVPSHIRQQPLHSLNLPEALGQTLTKNKISTVGTLLFAWGNNPKITGLNKEGIQIVQKKLADQPQIKDEWIMEAPWRIWNPDHVWNGLIWVLILAVIGARLYHVLTPSPSMAAFGIESPADYFRNPYQLINLRNGGLGIYGGILGGAVGLFIYARRVQIPLLPWADLGVVGLTLGQVFGRWGNFFNQELYGSPSDLPWAVMIEPGFRLPAYSEFSRFHPAFLYESLWSLLAFLVLYFLVTRCSGKLLDGEGMALYLIFYAIGRTLLELVRLDSRMVDFGFIQLNMAIATFVSIVIAVCMAAWIFMRRWRTRK